MKIMSQSSIILTLIALLFIHSQSIRFCFQKNTNSNIPTNIISQQPSLRQQPTQNEIHPQSQLRSYHPHYLNSLSFPHPVTPHIYYGQVIDSQPIFLFKNIQRWNPKSIQKLTINGKQFTDASAKYYLLRRQQQFRYMLVVQMQNSYDYEVDCRIEYYRRKDHFLVVAQFENRSSSFAIYLTRYDVPMELTEEGLKGINLYIRNQSAGDFRHNWRYSEQLKWRGRNNILNMNSSKLIGLIIQIQYFDRNLLREVKINLKEIPIKQGESCQSFAERQEKQDLRSIIKIQKIQKNQNCSNSATQKIFQGLSYEFGTLRIKNGSTVVHNDPKSLLSFCPSRKRFPWGFLWDDGFHCEVAVRMDEKLVLKVIKSWLDTMLPNGWIPRQQNRGAQREYLCSCPRFMQKDMRDGNPPTLILALDYLRRNGQLNALVLQPKYWQMIKLWYQWFLLTQKDNDIYLFRWHDSINQMGASFTSGMDDFPRPTYTKGNIDLQSWMYFFTKFMTQTSHLYGQSSTQYINNLQLIKSNFILFIDLNKHLYMDIANNTGPSQHFGYPSILPIAFGVPKYHSKEYNATLAAVKQELDSGAGLTSISMKSPYYLQNRDAYWKGPVWLNINYLFLRGLKLFYPQQKQYYNKLRNDLLRTVCGNWQKTGYFYQNYIRGQGSFSYPFNGWTSLIAIISNQNY